MFFNGEKCSSCTSGQCPIGMYRSACSANDDSRCLVCPASPAHSFFKADGSQDKCEWACEKGYFKNGQACTPCSSGPCTTGMYRADCSRDSDSKCSPCTNLAANSVFTSAGQPGDPKSCQVACADGFWNSGKACVACDTSNCAVGKYRSKCLANSNSQCLVCTAKPLPS